MNHTNHYKKRLPSTLIATAAIAGLSVAMLPFASAHAQSDRSASPASSIVEDFFEWRGNSGNASSSIWDRLPSGIVEKIFDHWQMPGDNNDETDPVISDIDTAYDNNEVEIMWNTDERTRGVVYISTNADVDPEDEDALELSSWRLSTTHSITTDDLDEDTTYYAVIQATDRSGNQTLSDAFSFTTNDEDSTDDEAPKISDLETEVTDTEATITWDTNEDADSYVYLSTSTPVDIDGEDTLEISSQELTDNHELTASDLEPDTIYYGRVTSTDADGNTATSSQFTFSTDEDEDDDTAPTITAIDWEESTTTVTVSWETDEPSTSAVYTATSSGFSIDDSGVSEVTDNDLTSLHELTVTGLTPDTTYYHRIVSIDADGNERISAQYTVGTD